MYMNTKLRGLKRFIRHQSFKTVPFIDRYSKYFRSVVASGFMKEERVFHTFGTNYLKDIWTNNEVVRGLQGSPDTPAGAMVRNQYRWMGRILGENIKICARRDVGRTDGDYYVMICRSGNHNAAKIERLKKHIDPLELFESNPTY